MEDHKMMIFLYYRSIVLLFLLINFLFLKGIKSEVYTVGDEQQWNAEVNFDSWVQEYNFTVGDVLVFKYSKGQHNVYEVTEATYRSCDASSGVLGEYESGNDQITLEEAKKYWFICNIAGHCLGGMRFGINVKEATSSNTNSTRDSPLPPVEPTNYSSVIHGFQRWNFGILFLSSAVLLFKLY
ncbi:hypothetical protein Pint_34325 [Pistacia integerrima]|uniref:Uncharacterized protein n=1 Tax=Pistacia integerrima TaxID=434235 RepID=A0ACC0X3X4_9ROSI|nr:hypothetical protein Pint_34325 [Pistacia integerrima]